MDASAELKALRETAAAEAAAVSSLLSLAGQDIALGAAAVLRSAAWLLMALTAAISGLLLLTASAVALGLWAGLEWPFALLSGALVAGLLALACATLARWRLARADLSATRRQAHALLASLVGRSP